MNIRPETTLFMLMSVDGKISTGDTDVMDVDSDFPKIEGIKEGLHQYYELEKQTDLFSLITGKVLAKIGINEKTDTPVAIQASFVVIDNEPHLTAQGVAHLAKKFKNLFVVTANISHPAVALSIEYPNIKVLRYDEKIDFHNLFEKLYKEYGAERLTIQSGGTLNAVLLREGLIDHLSIVVAPALVDGKDTPTLIDGESLHSQVELSKIKALKFKGCDALENSYLQLRYDVINH